MSRRRPWNKKADNLLKRLVDGAGESESWDDIAEKMRIKGFKYNKNQCRSRWVNVLSPSVNSGTWTKEEEDVLFSEWNRIGNQWVTISYSLPGRSENQVKNRFYSTIRRLLRKKQKLFPLETDYFKTVRQIIKDKQRVLELLSESTDGIYRKKRYKNNDQQTENAQTYLTTAEIEDLEIETLTSSNPPQHDCLFAAEYNHIDFNLIIEQIINEFS